VPCDGVRMTSAARRCVLTGTGAFATLGPVTTKDIRTSAVDADVSCDVCGRTLLRGERAHPYLERGQHRSVCELCTVRAQEEGWVREGTVPAYGDAETLSDRRRSLLSRFLRRRLPTPADEATPADPVDLGAPAPPPPERPRARAHESRHVRAIPSSAEQRIAFAIDAFNASEHPRTVAGVARSLGLPIVSVRPVADRPSVVRLVVAWELCWYRYEFDLADEDGGVRLAGQGQELDELTLLEREPNAVCGEDGSLGLA
jgi:hypothetical protein